MCGVRGGGVVGVFVCEGFIHSLFKGLGEESSCFG